MSTTSEEEFEEILKPILENTEVQKMNDYIQHCDVSCFDHCKDVAYYTYIICKKLKLDYKSATRAAMLHDFFLYDWRVKSRSRSNMHGFVHPRVALENASKYFDLNKKEKDVILKHMWPLTVVPPKYLESFIITLTDKYSTLIESYKFYRKRPAFQRVYSNFIIFLAILFLKS